MLTLPDLYAHAESASASLATAVPFIIATAMLILFFYHVRHMASRLARLESIAAGNAGCPYGPGCTDPDCARPAATPPLPEPVVASDCQHCLAEEEQDEEEDLPRYTPVTMASRSVPAEVASWTHDGQEAFLTTTSWPYGGGVDLYLEVEDEGSQSISLNWEQFEFFCATARSLRNREGEITAAPRRTPPVNAPVNTPVADPVADALGRADALNRADALRQCDVREGA